MISALLAALFAWPTPLPTSTPAPQPTVLWRAAPAAAFALEATPLESTPDGARVLVRVRFRDAHGGPTSARHGTDFDWYPSRGDAQWQTGLRYGGPAAIVTLADEAPLRVRVVAHRPDLGTRTIALDPRAWHLPRVVAQAVGPHLVRVGWFPRLARGGVRIERVTAGGVRGLAALAHDPQRSFWDDPGVAPDSTVRYRVTRPGEPARTVTVQVPPELPPSALDAVRGKGAWLAFSGDPLDDDGFAKLDADGIVATAKAAGLRYVELRLAYGAFDEVTAAAKPTVDRLIDGLDGAGIAVVGWTVPRALDGEDLRRDVAVAAYRTPAGHRITGLAVDLERGEEFMGSGPRGAAALRGYLRALRAAVGPRVLLAANVEDPFLERLDGHSYPYAEIAAAADVLQPMTYWRFLGPRDSLLTAEQAVTGSLRRLRALAGPGVPLSLGAQTTSLSRRGAPPADELRAAVEAGRREGAIGVIFYDWNGTAPEQWQTIADTRW